MPCSLYALTVDCADAATLARFWSSVLDRPVDPDPSEDFATIGLNETASHGAPWMFTKVPEAKRAKNRLHPDLASASWPAEVERLIVLGATRLGDFDQDGATWTSLTDPEGNEFDVVAQPAG